MLSALAINKHLASTSSHVQKDKVPIVVKNENTTIIEDAYLVAALITIDPSLVYFPVLKDTGRVVFEVKGAITDTLERYYGGEGARLDLFVINHKKLRAAIFKLKNAYKKTRSVIQSEQGES